MSSNPEATMIDTIIRLVRREMREEGVIPYMAEVVSVGGGRVGIQALDEEDPAGTSYARVAGVRLNAGDLVVAWRVSGETFVLGRMQASAPGPQRIEGGLEADNIVGAITSDQIGENAVTEINIAEKAVELRHIGLGQVSDNRIISMDAGKITGTIDGERFPAFVPKALEIRGDFYAREGLSFYGGPPVGKYPDLLPAAVTSTSFTSTTMNQIRVLANALQDVFRHFNLADHQ